MELSRSNCGELGLADVGSKVCLCGWVDALRDHGEVLFIHLRDRSGIVQVLFSPEKTGADSYTRAGSLKDESCITVTGDVVARIAGTENTNLETGLIEVAARELTILSQADVLPFPVSEKAMIVGQPKTTGNVTEDLRLQYRYLDLRRPSMQANLIKRHRINKCVRDFLDEHGFIEVETPILTKSTPEGARDYLVPSRVHPRNFYALPQSPQLFKQLLMVSGLERYFQIAR
nr:OB-fold nucleic acid binding domain-containing protein [Syntrophales bacterium]